MAANPNRGKTHTRYARVILDGYDISGDMRAIGNLGYTTEQADATGWSNGTKQWLSGQGDVSLSGLAAIFDNDITGTGPNLAGAHTVLSGGGTFDATVALGIQADPAIGNPSFSAVFESSSYTVSGGGGDPVLLQAEFFGSSTVSQNQAVWGALLHAGAELGSTTNNASVDNGASSANGWIAFLHVTQTAGAQASNNWSFVIEHSTDDSSWATLTTFTANGNAITSERKTATGTVNRYVRLKSTRTAGTARPWVSFIRM